ncbi:MAG: ergothioneine biosynthesis protein EgtB [Halioglobus sp.]
MSDAIEKLYRETRAQSLAFCGPLNTEDYGLQAEPFVSPPKWHLAHTTWFFETFLLKPFLTDYVTPDSRYEVLFNSYYNGIGEQFSRHRRGLLSRPTVAQVLEYRSHVDHAMARLLAVGSHPDRGEILVRAVLGVEHERQHQELFFTDIKYSLAMNPMLPAFAEAALENKAEEALPLQWCSYVGGVVQTGFDGDGFCYDNELPRHKVFLESFELAHRLVSNGEYQQFIDDGGYRRPELWLADGWATVQAQDWQMPLYWRQREGEALEYTLHGLQPRLSATPVCHVSGYEADAYARWADARLPTESEWEYAAATDAAAGAPAAGAPATKGGVDEGYYHPRAAAHSEGLLQLYGECWQWTQSAYSGYPGFTVSAGAIGEYNGKFMSNQWVLRGGSCVSKSEQLRPSYRNFFYPQDRWQFSGIRLARNLAS